MISCQAISLKGIWKTETLDVYFIAIILLEYSHIVSFAIWCGVTAIIIGITSFSYKAFLGRKKNETSAS